MPSYNSAFGFAILANMIPIEKMSHLHPSTSSFVGVDMLKAMSSGAMYIAVPSNRGKRDEGRGVNTMDGEVGEKQVEKEIREDRRRTISVLSLPFFSLYTAHFSSPRRQLTYASC
jgi:hypothetical protein